MKKVLILLIFLAPLSNALLAQVYPYQPIDYFNTESNPSALADKKTDLLLSFNHAGIPVNQNEFRQYSGSFSKYFEGLFLGTGVYGGKVTLNDSINYQYGGIGVGYRTVIFNSIFLKLGANIKHLQLAHYSGQHSYYQFDHTAENSPVRNENNLNISLSVTLPSDALYFNIGILNIPLHQIHSSFESYQYVSLGNLLRLIDKNTSSEISYTAINTGNVLALDQTSHYLNMTFGAKVSRKASIMLGGRYGWANQENFHCTPMIGFERYLRYGWVRKDRMIQLKLGYDLTYSSDDFNSIYPGQFQTYLTYKF